MQQCRPWIRRQLLTPLVPLRPPIRQKPQVQQGAATPPDPPRLAPHGRRDEGPPGALLPLRLPCGQAPQWHTGGRNARRNKKPLPKEGLKTYSNELLRAFRIVKTGIQRFY